MASHDRDALASDLLEVKALLPGRGAEHQGAVDGLSDPTQAFTFCESGPGLMQRRCR
jgi:hypothetical protein